MTSRAVLATLATLAIASCGVVEKSTPTDAGAEDSGADALSVSDVGLDTTFADVSRERDGGDGSSSGGSDSSGSGSSSGGATCGQCTSDIQCQQACPPVQGGGTNCCDTGNSGFCYATLQSSCPPLIGADAAPAVCIIGGTTYASGTPNSADPCQSCQPGASTTTWTDGADGASCGTGKVCKAGSCGNGWTFSLTGAAQSVVVPAGVTRVTIVAYGAGGPDVLYFWLTTPTSMGGETTAVVAVTPGETLWIFVGGQGNENGAGGFNGGGAGSRISSGGTTPGGFGGGGSSDVRQGGSAIANRVVVAGGGGGGASPGAGLAFGGAGGGTTGGAGTGDDPGQGGTQSAGGLGGPAASACTAGGSGTLGTGGDGSCGGGGGGGYYGGGGGGGQPYNDGGGIFPGSGGGGSSFAVATATGVTMQQGVQAGDGLVIITY